jgi:hypothetical protein
LGYLRLGGRIVSKWIFKAWGVICTGFIRLVTKINGGLLRTD